MVSASEHVELPVDDLLIILVLFLLNETLPIPFRDSLRPNTLKDLYMATFRVLDHHPNVVEFTACHHPLHLALKRFRFEK